MEHTWVLKYTAEFFGTMIMILFGNGAVANSFLRGTTGNPHDGKSNGGTIMIAFGYGFGIMIPAMLFGAISGNHLNPAVTIAQASAGAFPWEQVLPYIVAQMLGAIIGQLLVLAMYWPHFKKTENANAIFACFATGDVNNSKWNGFWSELIATAILMFAAVGIYRGMFYRESIDVANIGVGFLIVALIMSLGGPTGPALNPARDLGPRIVHAVMPIPNKGSSHWGYSWIPVVAPILGAIIGIAVYRIAFL